MQTGQGGCRNRLEGCRAGHRKIVGIQEEVGPERNNSSPQGARICGGMHTCMEDMHVPMQLQIHSL